MRKLSTTTRIAIITLLLLSSSPLLCDEPQTCPRVPLQKSIASASIWANAFGRDHSVGSEVERLLREGIEKVQNLSAPEKLPCLTECQPTEAIAQISITSVPQITLRTPEAMSECAGHERTSQLRPFRVNTISFTDADDLNDWVSDFSRGNGEQGEKLYKYCPGSCSPRYEYFVTFWKKEMTSHYDLETVATCGLPRDTDDNQYVLETAYQWKCLGPKKTQP